MPELHIIGYDFCPFIQPAITLLEEHQISYKLTYLQAGEFPDWLKEISPQGRTPLLISDGQVLFDSAAINEYLDETASASLLPEDAIQRAVHRRWINFCELLLEQVYLVKTTCEAVHYRQATDKLQQQLSLLAGAISDKGFFNGEMFCLTDAVYVPLLRSIDFLDREFSTAILSQQPQLQHWAIKLLNHPSVKKSVPPGFDQISKQRILATDGLLSRRYQQADSAGQ